MCKQVSRIVAVVLAVVLFCTFSFAYAIMIWEPVFHDADDSSYPHSPLTISLTPISLKHVTFDEIKQAAADGDVDRAIYPSGMDLPTKYWDAFMFSEWGYTQEYVPYQVVNFLKKNWPTEDGTYTYAEVYSAVMFYAMYSWVWYEGEDTFFNCHKASNVGFRMTDTPGVDPDTKWFYYKRDEGRAIITDYDKLNEWLTLHEDVLRAPGIDQELPLYMEDYDFLLGVNGEGIIYTIGYEYLWWKMSDFHVDDGSVRFSDERDITLGEFIDTRDKYLASLGAKIELCGRTYMSEEQIYEYNGFPPSAVNWSFMSYPGEPLFCRDLPEQALMEISEYEQQKVEALEPETPVDDEEEPTGDTNSVASASYYGPPAIDFDSGDYNNYADDVDTPKASAGITNGETNMYDILTVVSTVVVVLAMIAGCVVSFMRRRESKNNWKRW